MRLNERLFAAAYSDISRRGRWGSDPVVLRFVTGFSLWLAGLMNVLLGTSAAYGAIHLGFLRPGLDPLVLAYTLVGSILASAAPVVFIARGRHTDALETFSGSSAEYQRRSIQLVRIYLALSWTAPPILLGALALLTRTPS